MKLSNILYLLQISLMRGKNSRYIAIETLHQLRRKRSPLPLLFEGVCAEQIISTLDRSLAMNIIYGVLRNYQYLEKVMALLCKPPVKKLHPLVFEALAVGLYQIIFLSRIPESAAVNETVNAAKAVKIPKRLHGFINGVLRQSIRMRHELPGPDSNDSHGPILNHPDWLTSRWAKRFGREEMEAICRSNNNQQPLSLRLGPAAPDRSEYMSLLSRENIATEPGRYAPDALLLPGYNGAVKELPGYQNGWFQVQGEAAQLGSYLLQPFGRHIRCLDACAGLGGKTMHLLHLLTGYEAELVAVEPQPHRQSKLQENMQNEPPSSNFSLFRGDLQEFAARKPPHFQAILLDAPCSGTGVIGRQPDIRWRRSIADIDQYAKQQTELLALAASLLLPGGVLVYATCSLEEEENMGVVSSFLQGDGRFTLTDCRDYLPDGAADLIRDRCFQPRPWQNIDGFFGARLVRNNGDD